jgi:hypothetical protein
MPVETTEEEFPLPNCGEVHIEWDVDEEWEWDDQLEEDVVVVENSPYGRATWTDPQNERVVTAFVYKRESGAARRELFLMLLQNIKSMRRTYPTRRFSNYSAFHSWSV